MTDVLERLRAANPVHAGSPPSFEEVWACVERDAMLSDRSRHRWRWTRVLGLVLSAAAVALILFIALTTPGHRSTAASGGESSGGVLSGAQRNANAARLANLTRLVAPHPSADGVSRTLVRNFATLRRSPSAMRRGTGGLVPAWIATTRLNQQFGLDPAAAVEATENGMTLWFVPGARNVCIGALWTDNRAGRPAVSGGCGSVASANDGNMIIWHVDQLARTVTVWGLAPDTNTTVTVTLAGGSTRTVSVENNIYSLTMRPGPGMYRSVTLRDATGKKRTYTGPSPANLSARAAGREPIPPSSGPGPLPAALVRSFHVFRGLEAGQARLVANLDGLELSVVPGTTQVCLGEKAPQPGQARAPMAIRPKARHQRSSVVDCVPNSMALAGEMSPITGGPSGVTVTGLAPDGNRTVRLVLADGSSETVPVSHNIYIAHAPPGFKAVTLKDSRGALRSYRVPDSG